MKHLAWIAGCLTLLTASAMPCIAQQRTKLAPQIVAPPIKITPLSLNAKKTWLTKPVIEVENTSSQPIEYLVIEIAFPRDTTTKEIEPFMLVYGQAPGGNSNSVAALQPGGKISLSVNNNACDWVKSQLRAIRPKAGYRVNTKINAVVFAGKTAWFDGLLHQPDPTNPSRWLVIKNSAASDFNRFQQFRFTLASYNATQPQQCWDRLGTEWRDCCGLQVASAVMFPLWGGLWLPEDVSIPCGDGTFCEYTKQVGCI